MKYVVAILFLVFSGHSLASSPTPGDELGMYLMYKHGVSSQEAQRAADRYDQYYQARRAEEYRRFKGQAIVAHKRAPWARQPAGESNEARRKN